MVKGQRVFLQVPWSWTADRDTLPLEIDGGRVEIVTKAESVTAESVESAKAREGVQ